MTSDKRKGRKPPANRHDTLFRAILEDPDRAATLIREYLPTDIRKLLSDEPPRLVDGTFVDEAMRTSQSDRLFEVQLKDGKPALVFVIVEHKSSADPRTPLQILAYQVRIWERFAENRAERLRNLPPIIPLLYYHGQSRWNVPLSIFDAIADTDELRPFTRSMQYILHDLGRIETRDLSRNDALRAGLAALKFAFARIPASELRQLLADLPDGDSFEITVIRYISGVYEMDQEVLEAALQDAKPERWEALMGTVAEAWTKKARQEGILAGKAEGLAEGKAEGKAEGMAEGEAKSLTRLLERRFGYLPRKMRDRIAAAELGQIETWFDAAIDAPDLAAVFEPGARH